MDLHKTALQKAQEYSKQHGQSLTEEISYGRGYKAGGNAVLKEFVLLSMRLAEDDNVKNNNVYYELNKTIREFVDIREYVRQNHLMMEMDKPIPDDVQEIINNNFWEML